jgi:hypothetical protein
MLFTIFNTAALEAGMGGFKFKTEDEEYEEFSDLVDFFRAKGVIN